MQAKSIRSQERAPIGYWAAQEQYSLQDLLNHIVQAEKAGFTSTMTSDHFHPWWHDNGFGNFTWVWIAAAAERTKRMQFVTGVTAPLHRYHPAIIAQAFASLDVLYPGRIGLGIGTGEAMNEVPLGYDWPKPRFRLSKTKEAIQVIRKLWYDGNNQERRGGVGEDKNSSRRTPEYDWQQNVEIEIGDVVTVWVQILSKFLIQLLN